MTRSEHITSPDDDQLARLCQQLQQRARELEQPGAWPGEQLRLCGEAGVYTWFIERTLGGQEWSPANICRGYLALSAACLTTTFVITQYMGACQRLAKSGNRGLHEEWLAALIEGRKFATVGISHLTTSRRHLARPVLRASESAVGWVLDGFSPWVTGSCHADLVVTGATLPDGAQILCAVPTSAPGVQAPPPQELVALSASCTGPIEFQQVQVPESWLLAGPAPNIMQQGTGGNTGGVQTSTLALGLARAALDYLEQESQQRADLQPARAAMREEWESLAEDLLSVSEGDPGCSTERLRTRANSLVLRATQAALVAAKGAGFVAGHHAGRWCREALFFLVWSCPQNVLSANLCELAGIAE